MAEHSPDRRKARLVAELEDARKAFSRSFREVRRDADLPAHFREGFQRHKVGWLAGATGVGWVLALFSRRKKKLPKSSRGKGEGVVKKTEKLGILFMILRFAFSIFKPALMSFVTDKVADYANRRARPMPRVK